ncbi:hypothetical protein TNCV_3586851 [Trichonephila clavipes]|nr:hypothetical protein TNCV_3586851 [Trichonephila clavipes]
MFSRTVCTPSHDKMSPLSASISRKGVVRSRVLNKSSEEEVKISDTQLVPRRPFLSGPVMSHRTKKLYYFSVAHTPSNRESSREVGLRGRDVEGPFSQNWGETELNRTVTFMVLKTMANYRRTSSPLP